ncbi:hypothetical protein PSQ20_02200 [Curvibacter sp. RS43]|uniref:hypothetical protein n=1 Tax=Curvibacter microcysteis TaxID=3026419 RepID=UPI00235DD4C1|nr:hypothetical protein [Curvibacter sp. RS43]MDD0809136.1 hypothetical protein [Curvibacter sp. RS43]
MTLSFELKAEAGEDFDPACLDVVVFQGDSRIEGSRITLSASGTGVDRVLRLKTSVPVDEPAVSVTLRAGCDVKTSRRYVLLTELPQDGAGSVQSADAPLVRAPVATGAGSTLSTNLSSSPLPPLAGKAAQPREPSKARSKTSDAAPVAQRTESVSNSPRKPKEPAASATKARLKLDAPTGTTVDYTAGLRFSPSLAVVPQDASSPQRVEALAAWSALNRSLEQVLADADKRHGLEAENKRLKAAGQTAQEQVNDLQARLTQAEEERYANPVVYGLVAGLLLLLGAGAYVWRRQGQQPVKDKPSVTPPGTAVGKVKRKGKTPWWQAGLKGSGGPVGASSEDTPGSPLEAAASELPKNPSDRPAFEPSVSGLHVDLDLSESAFRRLEDLGAAPAAAVAPAIDSLLNSVAANATALPSQTEGGSKAPLDLFDVQQHAEFFVSLGQYDEAIEVLQKHIETFPEATPLAYLDLLKIHHMLSRTGEYAHWRERFNAVFSAEVPPFSAFAKGGKSLESYPRTLSYLEKVWGSARALVAVEDSLFRAHAVSIGEFFDLEAFKDLLVLQAVARQLAQDASLQGTPTVESRVQAGDLSMAFQSARDVHASTTPAQLPVAFMPVEPISGFGPSTQMPNPDSLLDLDLSDLSSDAKAPPAAPAPSVPNSVMPALMDLDLDSLPPPRAETVPALPSMVSPLDSPLDFVLDSTSMPSPLDVELSLPQEPNSGLDDSHMIDFDMFEADLLKASKQSKGSKG